MGDRLALDEPSIDAGRMRGLKSGSFHAAFGTGVVMVDRRDGDRRIEAGGSAADVMNK